ncbi:MAG: hypothetical protein ACYDAI_00640 [Trichloromonadaceae bacterium]
MNPQTLSLTLLTLFSLASIGLWIYVGLHLSRLTRTMLALREGLSSTSLPLPTAVREEAEGFSGALLESEAKKRFGTGEHRQAPEKYSYVRSLVAQGMGAVEIASVLNLSRAEVEQLISLAKLSRHHSEG